MRRYRIAIFLSILFILAFVNANTPSIRPIDITSSINAKLNACLNTNLNYPDSDLERCNIHSHIAFAHQGLQKIPGFITGNTTHLVISSLLSSSATFPVIELFDNNYLSHNYPSHNFW